MTLAEKKPRPAEMYEQYFVPAIFEPWSKVLISHAKPEKGERVLDLACGTGIITRQLAEQIGKEGKITGCDFSADMLSVARAHKLPQDVNIEWREENAISLNLPDHSFNLVVCQQGFQFFPDRAKAAQEIKRVLAPGGRAVVAVWKSLDHHPLYKEMFEAEASHLGVDLNTISVPFSLGDDNEVKKYFSDAGFKNVNVTSQVKEVKFPSPEKFVALTLLAGAAVIPEFNVETPEEQQQFVNAISSRIEPVLKQFKDNDYIRFNMTSNIAIAYV